MATQFDTSRRRAATLGGSSLGDLLDLLGRRWSLRIVWELKEGPLGFRTLQQRCDAMSSSVLSQRLGELADAGIVEARAGSWRLTAHGERLVESMAPMQRWARNWGRRRTHRG
jgi:DNA-binding HxlR family transcriptional regulator